ncbi:BMP-binding endothelial regulator protein-like [Saccoglossus kowalevskii]|uniref:IgGFc-binding protein-like n=1 Tax=Saccoglossus kowalevskii TaxID=10224 RepID=A0ABM0GXN9_SACKO|nr:PREDICTED: IgGFc-binding protein-like [Saccoglossus kowalevskii]
MLQLRRLWVVVALTYMHTVSSASLKRKEMHVYRRRNIECYTMEDGTDYRGTVSVTMPSPSNPDGPGDTCINWTPKQINDNPNTGLGNHNYCRNPDNDPLGPWCYTSNPNALFRFCDVGSPSTYCGGGGAGDPHMVTFDGNRFNFQGYCTYVLVRDCRDSGYSSFEITSDFRGKTDPIKPPTRMVDIKIAVTGIPRLTLLEDNSYMVGTEIFFNGTSVSLGDELGSVTSDGNTVTVQIKEPELSISWNGKPHKVMIWLNDEQWVGNICGMLGNADGNPANDFIKPNGQIASDTDDFGNSWTVPGSCPRF